MVFLATNKSGIINSRLNLMMNSIERSFSTSLFQILPCIFGIMNLINLTEHERSNPLTNCMYLSFIQTNNQELIKKQKN